MLDENCFVKFGVCAYTAQPQATNLWSRDAQIRKQFQGVSTHEPDIFTLPRDHNIAQQPMLQVKTIFSLYLIDFT